MKANMTILFYPRRTRINSKGRCQVITRITIDGKRYEFSIGRLIDPNLWSKTKGRMKGNSQEARSVNRHLDILRNKIVDIQMECIHNKIPITLRLMNTKVIGEEKKQRMLMEIFADHNKRIEELVGKEYAPGTLERYKTSLKHTRDFLLWKFKVDDVNILDVNHAFITDYEFYLRSVRNCSNNTAVKYIKNFGKIIRMCLANDWLDKNPFANYKAKVRPVERVYLTEGEIQKLLEVELRMERLDLVRDIFLFSCYTGLAYIDVKNLTTDHISIGIDGEEWIFTHRQKTEAASKIPILPVTQSIINKYKEHPKCIITGKLFPIFSNQKMNAYLKEIANLC